MKRLSHCLTMHLDDETRMRIFSGKNNKSEALSTRKDFEFISEDIMYLDSACQTLRPQPVLDAVLSYYREYNACGGRVKYEWGKRVDEEVAEVRMKVLNFVGKSTKEYAVAFTLNTTYGLNLLLHQLPVGKYKQIITSEIEHNSVFLPTIAAAARLQIRRKIFPREEDGSLEYKKKDVAEAIIALNATSNIDGRILRNAQVLANDVHSTGGVLIIDGAQSMVDDASYLREVDFDALCFSSHKTYGPSLGVIVAKKQLIDSLSSSFTGGGMVESLDRDSFSVPPGDFACKLEPGLQDFAGIIGLGEAVDWLKTYKPEGVVQKEQKRKLATMVFESLSSLPGMHLLNYEPSSIISCYSEDVDAHRLATFLSQQHIMVRSGYFCCHYYLQNMKKYPPLLRVSLGLHNTEEDVSKFLEIMEKILRNIQ